MFMISILKFVEIDTCKNHNHDTKLYFNTLLCTAVLRYNYKFRKI